MKKKNSIICIVIIVLATTIGSSFGQGLVTTSNSFEEQLKTAANEINKRCPAMVDKDTRLDNAIAGPGKTMTYNYTLVNHNKKDLDINVFESFVRPNHIKNIKTNQGIKSFRENNVTMIYNYKDKNGIFIYRIEIKPKDYKE